MRKLTKAALPAVTAVQRRTVERLAGLVGRAVVVALLLGGIVVLPASPAAAAVPEPPRALPQNATAADLKWQPALDYDTDGCYNVPAIGPDGRISEGLDNQDTTNSSDCRDPSDLDNTNAYSRQRCNSGWCVYLYDYYFEKDVSVEHVAGPGAGGHRHDWEHIAVWVHNDQAEWVAASAHGHYEIKPADEVRWDGTHPKIVYHKDGILTHAFRFATAGDEPPENHDGQWRRSTLVSYSGFPGGLRDKLFAHDFGGPSIGIRDAKFAGNLEGAMPTLQVGWGAIPVFEFDYGRDEGSPGDPNPPADPPTDPPDDGPGLPPGPTDANLRVMPLGDSITYGVGSSTESGYRADLWNMLKAYTDKVAFVGSQDSGRLPDDDHEGYPGRRIDEVAAMADCTVKRARPNVVTLHLGTNDMNQNYDLANAPKRLGDLIDQVLTDAPDATVLVATLIPTGKPGLQPRIDAFNSQLPALVQKRRDAGQHVALVRMDTAVDVADGLQNDAHPNDAGYRDMATAFLSGINTAYERGWIEDPEGPEGDPKTCAEGFQGDLGEGWDPMGVIAPGMGGPAGRTDLVELNGDHRADYVKIFPDGSVRAALNTQQADGRIHWVDQGIIAPGVGQPGESVRFADMNGDGRDDYLILGAKGSSWSFLNTPGSDGKFHWDPQGRIYPYHHDTKEPGDESGIELGWEREDVRLADVNGDGLDDYLVVGPAGSMDAYVRNPNTTTWSKIDTFATGTEAGPRARMRLADVNGDRKVDYLIVGSTGAVHAYINHMSGMSDGNWTEHKYFANESSYPDTTVAFRDVTGDFKADYLVVQGEQIQAWENLGGNNMPS
ncbi:NPP1 family protein [Streptomyces sp. NPDC019443]|uniref:NPP1 family protein n=1 Tax=Streptomyces sp. NPDC019443 TaxID=3365061 RepID=UPI00378D4B7D